MDDDIYSEREREFTFANNRNRDFWSEVRKIKNSTKYLANLLTRLFLADILIN